MLKAIAIDDEPIALEIIKKQAAAIPFLELLAVFTHAPRALAFLHEANVDLIFLDIKMPGMSGIDLVQLIPETVMVIFTTAYPEHAVQSFELSAIDYLLKPFSSDRFRQACGKAKEQYELRQSFQKSLSGPPAIFIKSGYEEIRLVLEDILYAEASGSYVQFVTGKNKLLSRINMKEAEQLLPKPGFVRIHRSYIVAVRHISSVEKNVIWIDKMAIPVSAAFTVVVQEVLKNKSG